MTQQHFDPAAWLDAWRAAGGAWIAATGGACLLRPAQADARELDRLAGLIATPDRQEAIRSQLEARQ